MLKILKSIFLTILLPLLIAIILRVFFLEMYKIPSSSMEPTLLPGDIILVSKMSYGARVLKLGKMLNLKRREYFRLQGWNRIRKGDVFVFNWPKYNFISDSFASIYGGCVVKRCYGLPGDCIIIKNEDLVVRNETNWIEEVEEMQTGNIFFPKDSTLGWSLNNYGPLYVPAKGGVMELTRKNILWYKDILGFEKKYSNLTDTSLILDGKKVLKYAFNNNYYFVLGDNFYYSEDSRYWGFVPEGNVIGKAILVLTSFDSQKSGLKRIRWDRFFIKIESNTPK